MSSIKCDDVLAQQKEREQSEGEEEGGEAEKGKGRKRKAEAFGENNELVAKPFRVISQASFPLIYLVLSLSAINDYDRSRSESDF